MGQVNLQAGIIDGRNLKDWWTNSPHGAFRRKCSELGIRLSFSDDPEEVLDIYEVEIEYTYRGRGSHTVTVEAFNEKDVERIALDKFDDSDIDAFDAEVDDCKVRDIKRKPRATKGSGND